MMKILALLMVGLCLHSFQLSAQTVQDPLREYYESFDLNHDSRDYHASPVTVIYYFWADLTGKGQKSLCVTDDGNRTGKGGYAWTVYHDVGGGKYERFPNNLEFKIQGPSYIGYVSEMKVYGAVGAGRRTVYVYYVDEGRIKIAFLGKNQSAEKQDYPQYFPAVSGLQIEKVTLRDLGKKYPSSSPKN
jgi:hypothetical protein